MLEDVDNPCSAACDLSRDERRRRASQVRGHVREEGSGKRRSPDQPSLSSRHGRKHKRKRSRSRDRQRDSPHGVTQVEPPKSVKPPASATVAESSSTGSLEILAALQALSRRLDKLEGNQQDLLHEDPLSVRPESFGEEKHQDNVDVLSLCASHTVVDDTTGGDDLEGELHSSSAEPADGSTETGEAPVSSLMSRVLSAAKVLGLQGPTSAPAPAGGVWEGISRPEPRPSIPVADDYTAMLRSSWGTNSKRPQFNAGCRQLANASYPVETGLGNMPPVESPMAALTSLGFSRVSSDPRCPRKECAKTDRLVTNSFNASARAARMGNALAITLAALRKTLGPDDHDSRALVDAALSSHSQLTRDVGNAM